LTGKVWNEPDGAVSVIVQGPDKKVSMFIEWCKQGPILAKVKEVIVTEQPISEIYPSFEIVRQ